MIVVGGLSPAWQTIMRFDRLQLGEVNRAAEVHQFASGKVINVAVAAAHLGEAAEVISPIGGATREMVDCELSALGVSRHWVVCKAATRTCMTLLDGAARQTTELVENAPPVTADELEEFAAIFAHEAERASVVVLTGSLPARTPPDFFATLMKQVTCPVILDARGPELLAALPLHPWLVKPNREELGMTLECPIDSEAALHEGMQQLVERGAQRVLITAGAQPASLWDGQLYRITPPTLDEVVNPIGCGDCLTAGIAVGLARQMTSLESVALGMAAAADNATRLLAARLDRDAVERFRQQVRITAVG